MSICYTSIMLGFNHTLAGSIVAIIVPAPLVPVVALVSHFVLDLTPHFGRSETVYPYTRAFKRLVVVDALLSFSGLMFSLFLFPGKGLIVLVGVSFSIFPDFLWLLYHRGPAWLDKFLYWAEWIQWGERPYGWILDVFYALMMCITLYLLAGQPWK